MTLQHTVENIKLLTSPYQYLINQSINHRLVHCLTYYQPHQPA